MSINVEVVSETWTLDAMALVPFMATPPRLVREPVLVQTHSSLFDVSPPFDMDEPVDLKPEALFIYFFLICLFAGTGFMGKEDGLPSSPSSKCEQSVHCDALLPISSAQSFPSHPPLIGVLRLRIPPSPFPFSIFIFCHEVYISVVFSGSTRGLYHAPHA